MITITLIILVFVIGICVLNFMTWRRIKAYRDELELLRTIVYRIDRERSMDTQDFLSPDTGKPYPNYLIHADGRITRFI